MSGGWEKEETGSGSSSKVFSCLLWMSSKVTSYSSLAELHAQIVFPKKVAVMCWQDIRGHAALRVWVVSGRNITETG